MNYVTPGVVRALEWISALVPELPHIYLTSSRDETIDKALRLVKATRKQAQVAIGLAGGYYGHTCASCRSLSDPEVHAGGPAQFDWPRLPHPAVAGTAATIAALRASGRQAGGADKIPQVRRRTRPGAYRARAAGGLRRRARGAQGGARHPGDHGRDHDEPLPQRQGRVPGHGARHPRRRDDVVGWGGADRPPARRPALVRAGAADAGVDLGRRRAARWPGSTTCCARRASSTSPRARRRSTARSRSCPRAPARTGSARIA